MPQGSVFSPTLYSVCVLVNDTPQTPGVCLGLSADDTCIYVQTAKRIMFSEVAARSQCYWDIVWGLEYKINEDKTQIIYSLFKSEPLSANIKVTLYKALISSLITYACPAWELAADTYLLNLQRLQNKILQTTGNLPGCTPVRDLHTAFNLPYVYYYVIKLCTQQAEVIKIHENEHVRGIGQSAARHRKYMILKLGGGQTYDRSSD
jgi:hypothetical protein